MKNILYMSIYISICVYARVCVIINNVSVLKNGFVFYTTKRVNGQ